MFCPFDGAELDAAGYSTSKRDSLVGFIVDERYEVLQLLGEGGMGCVYRVRHRVLGRLFALKALRSDLAHDRVTAERFVQEARAAASIAHPNVVTITDFGLLETGQPYFVMELLEGRTLSSLLRERGFLSPQEALSVTRSIASALGAAHDAGIIHRDLKPDNVMMLEPKGLSSRLKVLDFGLAMVRGNHRLTLDGVVFGTPRYMSPEQATGEPLDARVDMYALGIVMYEMLTGRVPFEADSYMGVLTKQLYAEPSLPSEFNSALLDCPELEQVVLRCLSKNRDDRFTSMRQLSLALEAIAASWAGPTSNDSFRSSVASVRPPTESRVRRRRSRHRLWGYAAFGALAFGVALVWLYGRWVLSPAGNWDEKTGQGLKGPNATPVGEMRVQQVQQSTQRVDAITVGRNGTRGSDVGGRSLPLSLDPGKNGRAGPRVGRSGGRVIVSDSESRSGVEGGSTPNSNDPSKLGSSEISDPWAQ